jgi:ATP-dependent helicase YprA (DUF1998 family)/rubrerythrin
METKNYNYTIQNFGSRLKDVLQQYIEAQYHIKNIDLIKKRKKLLELSGIISNEPYLEGSKNHKTRNGYDVAGLSKRISSLLNELSKNSNETGVYSTPFRHQIEAIKKFTVNGDNIVISTGTGSGKTESFLLPLLCKLTQMELDQPTDFGVTKAMILYPMNALVTDQTARLRKFLGSQSSKDSIKNTINRHFRFGNYTGLTQYAGAFDIKRNQVYANSLESNLCVNWNNEEEKEYFEQLKSEMRVPSKHSIVDYIQKLRTAETPLDLIHKDDAELSTRCEFHAEPADLVVTNYSMLEYMLLRPIEQSIFDKTKAWLQQSPNNQFTLVLDEAHMYTGLTGSEVSLLIRRFKARIGADSNQFRVILASASLGSDENEIKQISSQLTGLNVDSFSVVTEELIEPHFEGVLSPALISTLSQVTPNDIYRNADSKNFNNEFITWLAQLSKSIGGVAPNFQSFKLSEWFYNLFEEQPLIGKIQQEIKNPVTYEELCNAVFGEVTQLTTSALDAILAIGCLANSGANHAQKYKVLLPIRAHFMYRGLPGLYICINPGCESSNSRFGRMYADNRNICECGSKIYELLTHRTCGSAYIKGFWEATGHREFENLIIHNTIGEGSTDLRPVFLCIEPYEKDGTSKDFFVNHRTGEISRKDAGNSTKISISNDVENFKQHKIKHEEIWTNLVCPCCDEDTVPSKNTATQTDGEKHYENTSIMALATIGDDPFTYLVREQFRLQPPASNSKDVDANRGRKALIFSDGRQKAARLAKNLPDAIQKDMFRSYFIKAYKWLQTEEAREYLIEEDNDYDDDINRLSMNINTTKTTLEPTILYHGFLKTCLDANKIFFEGKDREKFMAHLQKFKRGEPVDFTDLPRTFFSFLSLMLCQRHYSVVSLAVAGIKPNPSSFRKLLKDLKAKGILVDEQTINAFVIKRIRDFLDYCSVKELPTDVLFDNFTHPNYSGIPKNRGLNPNNKRKANKVVEQFEAINDAFCERFLEENEDEGKGNFRLLLKNICLDVVEDKSWFQCKTCLYLTDSLTQDESCPACGSDKENIEVFNDNSEYFQARKKFWREPVKRSIHDTSHDLFIEVDEHTAQLNYRDERSEEKSIATVNNNELKFQGIVDPRKGISDRPTDILSSTTTMEVGIDIGSLIAVAMRNVPPKRQNYQQRAGRAGRRGSAFSTVLTFCQNGPHDSHYFKNPSEIIRGEMAKVLLEPNNRALVKRHVLSTVISYYFHKYSDSSPKKLSKKKQNNIFGHLGTLRDFLGTDAPCLAHMMNWVSDSVNQPILKKLLIWSEELFNESFSFEKYLAELTELATKLAFELQEYEKLAIEMKNIDKLKPPSELRLLDVLFEIGALPSYAFPIDLVELELGKKVEQKWEIKEKPTNSIQNGIQEYAPGRLVTIDKEQYQIGSMLAVSSSLNMMNKAELMFSEEYVARYLQCSNCGALHQKNEGNSTCCAKPNTHKIKVVKPRVLLPIRNEHNFKPSDVIYTRSHDPQIISGPIEPEGGIQGPVKRFNSMNNHYSVKSVKLAVINSGLLQEDGRSGFMVCKKCGLTSPPHDLVDGPHRRDYLLWNRGTLTNSPLCDGVQELVSIGFEITTDLSMLSFVVPENMLETHGKLIPFELKSACTTLAVALIKVFAIDSDISANEISFGIRTIPNSENEIEMFFYDTAQGGAGYANLMGKTWRKLMDLALKDLKNCTCDSRCYSCISSYDNRFLDSLLNRHLAISLGEYIKTGEITFDTDERLKKSIFNSLKLELETLGASFITDTIIELNSKEVEICWLPSLMKKSSDQVRVEITPYDIINRLAEVINEIRNR